MQSTPGILVPFLLLCLGVGACSGSSGPGGDVTTGGEPQTGGGAAASAGGSPVLPSGGTLGTAGSVGVSGAGAGELAGGTGGDSGNAGGSPQAEAGSSTGGAASGGGGTSAAGSNAGGSSPIGGTGGKPDQSTLPAITVHLAGDSTMSVYAASTTQEGWGQELAQFFIAKVTVDDRALPGANIQSFYGSRWKALIGDVKAGDYVLAAFGINDSGTTHGPVTPADFQKQMGIMADEVAAKKATFIPTTSSPLQVWVNGKETNARLQPYCDATLALGKAKDLLVDDLNARGVEYYNMIGQTAAAALTFNGDKAHFDKAGATAMAMLAAKDLARINSPLAAYLK
jgi:lysophospholipase L1-like esterase